MSKDAKTVLNRSCAGCTLCCFLPSIEEFDKPRMQWCPECSVGVGCKIYEKRPSICRTFHCRYLLDEALSEEWKPSNSNLMITFEEDSNRLVVHVDPATPEAWKAEPFYSQIKKWAKAAADSLGQVLVWEGDQIIAVLPDRDEWIGKVPADKYIITRSVRTLRGEKLEVLVVDEDHPLVALLPTGQQEPFA